jgi:rhodanese-related sulfurtransferase
MKTFNLKTHLLILLIAGILFSCNNKIENATNTEASVANTLRLLEWFEQNGNYINSPEIPSILDAQNVWAMREENIHIIDLRKAEDFRERHIEHAVNLQPSEVLDYFISRIEPSSFKNIFLVCYDLNTSGYLAGVLRLLGYNNVYAIRFGMSGWEKETAEKFWLANIGNNLVGKLETQGYSKNKPGDYPAIAAKKENGFDLALERAGLALNENQEDYIITLATFLENPDNYYTICYWPEDKYFSNGHLQGAVQYEPKKSLTRDTYLNTLPADKPVVVYCYSGQHSTYVAAYLRMLGYDAKSLAYGANGFIHEVMARTEPRPSRTFTEKLIQNLPVVKGGVATPLPQGPKETVVVTVDGEC